MSQQLSADSYQRLALSHQLGTRLSAVFATLYLLSAILTPAHAVTSTGPYTGIVDRNVFGLKPPTPVAPPTAPEPPPGNITLTGITTILGNKRALLKVSTPPRPPEPAKDENLMLTEGQRDGAVEVLEINEKAGSVKVNNGGQIATLTFDKNGAKAVSAAPGPGGIPAIPAPNAGGLHPSVANNNAAMPRTIPTRNMRTENASASQASSEGIPRMAEAASKIFERQAQNVTPEEQTIMIEAQRMQLQQQGKHEDANMFPITDVTPAPQSDEPSSPY
jgi:hypothetical protein